MRGASTPRTAPQQADRQRDRDSGFDSDTAPRGGVARRRAEGTCAGGIAQPEQREPGHPRLEAHRSPPGARTRALQRGLREPGPCTHAMNARPWTPGHVPLNGAGLATDTATSQARSHAWPVQTQRLRGRTNPGPGDGPGRRQCDPEAVRTGSSTNRKQYGPEAARTEGTRDPRRCETEAERDRGGAKPRRSETEAERDLKRRET
jgi:hypothetical protein